MTGINSQTLSEAEDLRTVEWHELGAVRDSAQLIVRAAAQIKGLRFAQDGTGEVPGT